MKPRTLLIEEATSAMLDQAHSLNIAYLLSNRGSRRDSGFVGSVYSRALLDVIRKYEAISVVRSGGRVVGYAYPMPGYFRKVVPELAHKFALYDVVEYRGKLLAEYQCYEIAQIVVDDEFKGQGLFQSFMEDGLKRSKGKYELFVSRVGEGNERSRLIHMKFGFEYLGLHTASQVSSHVFLINHNSPLLSNNSPIPCYIADS